MSARLLTEIEITDAVVRAIDAVDGFEVSEVGVRASKITVHLASGRDRVPSLAAVLGEVWDERRYTDFTVHVFRWRGRNVTIHGVTSLAGAA